MNSGTSYADSSQVSDPHKLVGTVLLNGEHATKDYVCFDQNEQAKISGMMKEGNMCMERLSELALISEPPKWYESKVLWFTIGLLVGGISIGVVTK